MNPTICNAITGRRVLELRYHGYSRIVEPHIYGTDRHGDEVLRCYQLAGGSESGERAGWKMLKVRDAQVVHLTETQFLVRPEYRRDDKVVRNVFCQA
ncbi:MAG TPA: hypothetical protein VEC01_12595 [Noviherbaspirillum sp.]|uniref:hypothetical protein n=1 Tax=Noviherbaspirillum sp. TaxID=1926288 RepID=UPI002D694AF7|nr:hypothetical protein [Noviherbaspirillum sp.]HYD96158.1 hypothetical protein [Noviherbaspirillum sp.]